MQEKNFFHYICRLCKPLGADNPPDFNTIATFTSNLAGNFEGVVQYNKDNRAFEVL